VKNYNILLTKISDIKDESIKALIDEIYSLRKERIEGSVIQFLDISIHTHFQRKESHKKRFDSNEVRATYYLREKIGKMIGTGIYLLMVDLVSYYNKQQLYSENHEHIEDFNKSTVYSLINKVMPDNKKRKKKRML